MLNKRKHQRFSATAFLNMPVQLSAVEPYFGHTIEGKLIDLAAGGMAILLKEIIPQGTSLFLNLKFPDDYQLDIIAIIKHVIPQSRFYLIGIEFLHVPPEQAARIEKMSADYIDCGSRIQNGADEICKEDCSFFQMCSIPQRRIEPSEEQVPITVSFHQMSKHLSK